MFSILWALLLPVVLGGSAKVDITMDTPGITWSSGWGNEAGAQYYDGTLVSVRNAGATLTYKFTGAAISVFGVEGTRNKRANSSYTLDGLTPRLHWESPTTVTPNVLFYRSATLEDTQHTLVIQNLVNGGVLRLDYFLVTGSAIEGNETTPVIPPSSPPPDLREDSLRPGAIAGLTVASLVVLVGFILLFIFWRRHRAPGQTERWEMDPRSPSHEDAQKVPFLNEHAHIEPFTLGPSQPAHAPTPAVTIISVSHPGSSTGRTVTTPTSHRDEKRIPSSSPGHLMESISQLNLRLDVNPTAHSVVGQSSDYGSEVVEVPHHYQNYGGDGGIGLLGSSETINPKALRLPPDYRRFYP